MPRALTAICRRSLRLRPPRLCPPAAWGRPSQVQRSRPRGCGRAASVREGTKCPPWLPTSGARRSRMRLARKETLVLLPIPLESPNQPFFAKVFSLSSDGSHCFIPRKSIFLIFRATPHLPRSTVERPLVASWLAILPPGS